ncbi:MAG: FimV family protein [Gammaproteobacteria bacterium]|nr:FimV family protein [Gammaproteobacteria bacterium]
MVRKLALAVSIALGAVNVPAHALGLGELNSKSALNQNFSGEIALLSVGPDEIDSLRVRLANVDAFERAGIERPFYLTLLKFEPRIGPAGKPVISVTSGFPIREPFLNFLVEVNWPNGRMFREYTVLLDPPTTTGRRPPQVTPPAQTQPARPQVATPARSRPAVVRPAPTPRAAVASSPTADEYLVKPNDTAWGIAKRVRPRGVTMEQMMMALLEANPAAFIDGNINRLRRGQILRVPTLDEIQQTNRQQARTAYRDQQDAWLERRDEKLQQVAAPAVQAPAPTVSGDDADDQLRIATARPEGEGEAGSGDSRAETEAADNLKTRLMVARENAETSRQEAETLRTRVDDLQDRLESMQKLLSLKDEQLAQLQDRIVSEDTAVEPASVLDQAATAAPDTEVVVVDDTAGQPATEDVPVVQEAPTTVAGDVVPDDYVIADIPRQIDPNRIVEQTMTDTVEVVPTEVDGAAAGPAEPVAPGVIEPAVIESAGSETAVAVVEPPQESTWNSSPSTAQLLDTLERHIVPLGIGSVLLLGLIGFAATRSKVKQDGVAGLAPATEPAMAGSAATAAAATATAVAADEPEPPRPVSDTAASKNAELPPELQAALEDLGEESSLVDDIAQGDADTLQDETGEVDPVSEADVYIAYGRYHQAEELLSQALQREPGRLALKHKLLEVHYATRNAGAFSALAREMSDAGQDTVDDMAWARAKDMGRELDPNNPLFILGEGDAEIDLAALVEDAVVDDDTLSLSELDSSYTVDDATADDDIEAPSEVSILLDRNAEEAAASLDDEMPDSITIDELDALEFEPPKPDAAGTVDSSQETLEEDSLISDSFDLDSIMRDVDETAALGQGALEAESEFTADELQAQLDELSDLSILNSQLSDAPDGAAQEPPASLGLVQEDVSNASIELDKPIDLDEAFNATADTVDDDVLDLNFDVGEPASSMDDISSDSVATKLDLARAYVEMGDSEGAIGILQEVANEGDESQRDEARQLIAELG